MNSLAVVCADEQLMIKCDSEFVVTTHYPDDDEKSKYSGEFIVMDPRPEDEIADKVRELKESIGNTVV